MQGCHPLKPHRLMMFAFGWAYYWEYRHRSGTHWSVFVSCTQQGSAAIRAEVFAIHGLEVCSWKKPGEAEI